MMTAAQIVQLVWGNGMNFSLIYKPCFRCGGAAADDCRFPSGARARLLTEVGAALRRDPYRIVGFVFNT